jgi:hypothetical protein
MKDLEHRAYPVKVEIRLLPTILIYFGYSRATLALPFVKNIKKGFQYKV